jgi:hypothetical protein
MVSRFQPAKDLDAQVAARLARPFVDRLADELLGPSKAYAPDGKIWITQRDEVVRHSHVETDGQTVPENLRYKVPSTKGVGTDLARQPRDTALPLPNRINCFPSTVRAYPLGDLRASIAAPYDGPMVTVNVASGGSLTGTPNHPVLTQRGWIALGALNVGDKLVRHRPRQRNVILGLVLRALPAPAPEVHHRPPTLGEVHRSLSKTGYVQRVARTAVDFHGDPPAGDVDVVRPHRLLHHRLLTRLAKHGGSAALPNADVLPGLLAALSFRGLLGNACSAAPTSVIRGQRKTLTLLGSGARHADGHSGPATPPLDTSSQQPMSDRSSVNANFSRQSEFGCASEVALDQILYIETLAYVGHVHTLSTSTDSFVADGFIVHNCRCESVPMPGVIAASINKMPTLLQGTRVTGGIESRFPRAGESHEGTSEDTAVPFMRRAIQEVAAAHQGSRRTR